MSTFDFMLGLLSVVGVLGVAAALVGLGFGIAVMHQHGRRITALETAVAELSAVKPHTRIGRAHQDIGEAFLFQLAGLLEDKAVMDERLSQIQDLAEHVRAGGKPDDLRSARMRKGNEER